ncbi:response regulator transcription factor [Enterococcus termitis]|uniref:Two-component system response regulator n=1 Tax=Enterococcus termitis TaxID=332950 RepID=A0A1E5GZ33_9ENTE|nr:response regulator transcription factor [Enterococcus termitis]OEG17600.1 two-component system response regulator [Enterococcus termitis]
MSYNVLLVDDEYMIVNGLKRIISWEEEGFSIKATARNAKEALALMESEEIDLVITDITMPEMTGLEFIEAAQKEACQFEFMILSGYQKFDFLKGGLQLGAINYLMKPVDKLELLKSVKKAKKRLDSRNLQETREGMYSEILLSQWVNGEIEISNYEELSQFVDNSEKADWTALIFEIPRERKQELGSWLKQQQQALYFSRNLGDKSLLIHIFRGSKYQLNQLLMTNPLLESETGDWLLSIGETVSDWEDVPDSFEKANQTLQRHKFYERSGSNILYAVFSDDFDLSTDIINFNKTLMVGDFPTIEETITEIFTKTQKIGARPEDVRHITFMLFMDIYRRFNHIDEEEYQQILDDINHSSNADKLCEILTSTIKEITREKFTYDYSENVQKVIDSIRANYATDITLKSVAQSLHLNVMYLGQLFKKETKKSFSQYLNQYRMKKAQNLLLYTEDNVNEIADQIGFNNSTYFSQLFKKMNDLTPKEFREKYKHHYHSVDDE